MLIEYKGFKMNTYKCQGNFIIVIDYGDAMINKSFTDKKREEALNKAKNYIDRIKN